MCLPFTEPGSAAALATLAARPAPAKPPGSPYGDGKAAARAVEALDQAAGRMLSTR